MRSSPTVAITVTGSGPTVLYLHGDHLGTPRVATNEANVVVWRNLPTGDPFGMALPEEEPDGDGRATVINLRFPGQYFDRETQLHYNYFRDYDPGTGRYVQSDPIGLKGRSPARRAHGLWRSGASTAWANPGPLMMVRYCTAQAAAGKWPNAG
jgi:RHS repeat-associated protein